MLIPILMIFLVIATFLLYKWAVASFDHFFKLNVVHDKPYPFFGSFLTMFFGTDNVITILIRQYEKYKHRSYFGIYHHRKPILVVTDPKLIRQIFVTDVDHFITGGIFNRSSALKQSVGELSGEKWAKVRSAMEECFSSSNLRLMFYSIEEFSEQIIEDLKSQIGSSVATDIDVFRIFATFFTNVLSTMTFGMKSNSLASDDKQFLSEAILSMRPNKCMMLLTQFFNGNFPWISERLRINPIKKDFVANFQSLVEEIIAYRHKHDIQHFDIVHILMNQSTDQDPNVPPDLKTSFTNEEVIAQCFVVLLSGYAKCSVISSSAVIELAANPHIQRKLQSEIDGVARRNGNKIPYDVLEAMDYLNMVVLETLRKWPANITIGRVCSKAYEVRNQTNEHSVLLQPGDCICVPACALHWDPEYFPEPHKFDPDGFNDNRRGFIRPYTFLPFGIGSRGCCGTQFALIQIKAALVSLFSEFDVELTTGKQGDVHIEDSIYVFLNTRNRIVRLKSRKNY